MKAGACGLLLALSFAGRGLADRVTVRAEAAAVAKSCVANAVLVARDAASGEVTRAPFSSGVATFDLPASRSVSVHADAAGCWSETAQISAQDRDVVVTLYKAAHMRSSFEPSRHKLPDQIDATVFRAPVSGQRMSASGHPLTCAYDDGKWDCIVPADLPIDLRLSSDGFAPIYYWNVIARPGETRLLEPRAIVAGASFSGWVEDADRKPLAGARLLLSPATNAAGEESRAVAREISAKSGARGFFQITGIASGEYRLTSRAEGLSPVLLPVVNIGKGEAVTWPRPITHLPYAALEVQVDPPVDSEGHPWTIALEERIPLSSAAPPLRRAAGVDGIWRAEKLRADDYRATLQDANGAVLERFDIDLSKSGKTTIPLTVHRLAVRGVLRLGDTPLSAEIHFSQSSGRTVQTKANDLGEFDAAFPASGKWTPTIYPAGPDGPRIRSKAITVPEPGSGEPTIEIVLPGGRVRGSVVNRNGANEKAAVHLVSKGVPIAQQLTSDDGRFDFIGIEEGDYVVDAEGRSGTARPKATHVDNGDTSEVKLELEPSATFSALVLTPDGAPASGAVVRVSTNGDAWTMLFTDVEGRFEYTAMERAPLQVIVVTYSYPSLIAQLSPDAATPPTLVLQRHGGKLRLARGGWIGRGGALAPINMFFMTGSPLGLYEGAAYLEPGVYSVCAEHDFNGRCRAVTIGPMSDVTIDPSRVEERMP